MREIETRRIRLTRYSDARIPVRVVKWSLVLLRSYGLRTVFVLQSEEMEMRG
jgi:hypothetical protein